MSEVHFSKERAATAGEGEGEMPLTSPKARSKAGFREEHASPLAAPPHDVSNSHQTGFGQLHQALAAAFCCLQQRQMQESLPLPAAGHAVTSTEECVAGSAALEK